MLNWGLIGAGGIAKVFCNGSFMGEHKGGWKLLVGDWWNVVTFTPGATSTVYWTHANQAAPEVTRHLPHHPTPSDLYAIACIIFFLRERCWPYGKSCLTLP